ncbi:extracellular solute-binding protein [Candidatus Parcubacteria bacterium]|nr:extracellular solute-binding protein [Candidatus Parcubacteria bacterium]
MSKFQVGLLIVFGAFIILAVILFSRSKGSSTAQINLSVWGSLSSYDFDNLLAGTGLDKSETVTFNYTEKSADSLDTDFVEALAEGRGPDLVIIPVESLLTEKSRILLIPSSSVTPSDFVSTFIEEGELFQAGSGTYALPLYVDPMVLYWNRDLFSKASLAKPLVYWDEIYEYINKLTAKDGAGNITSSAIALGEVKNIPHEKEILSLLMLQAGTPITAYSGQSLVAVMNQGANTVESPAQSALSFYTQFSDPTKSFNTWNRSLLAADTSFASGKSAMYLGFASELPVLKAKNPTLNLSIAPVPQSRVSGKAITFGRLYGVAISRGSKDPATALQGALSLVSKSGVAGLTTGSSYVPARRDLLSAKPVDQAGFVFYGAGLQARGWLDPNPAKSKAIFGTMAESVTSGRARVEEAVNVANSALSALIK